MVQAGVNRVSLGVQSFIDKEAHESGRLHSRNVVLDDLGRLSASGISNLNVDLIAGLSGQTFASWDESLDVLLESGVPHASVYMLEVDEDSRLGRELMAGGMRYRAGLVPSDDAIAQMYEAAISRLDSAGIRQYEVSNFARAGFESRHNLRYWHRSPYLGVGLDASSMLRDSQGEFVLRATTTDDLKEYLEGDTARETTWLDQERQVEEAWFLGLRTNVGVDTVKLEREFGRELTAATVVVAERLVGDGLLAQESGRFMLTPRGRLISNDVFQEFLAEVGDEASARG
jgi:oxygen-independent coproporphyrinogen-3 oxidase